MIQIRRILAGTDLGPDTEKVLAYASFFAGQTGAALNLLYVLDYLVTPPAYIAPYIEEEKKIAEENFRVWEKAIREHGVNAGLDVVVGRLHESFETAVQRLNADMLVLGFRHHALRRSSSEKLIKGLKVPMLVVRGAKADSATLASVKIRKILCPVDMSETSRNALLAARELQAAFSAVLDVLYVLPGHVIEGRAATPEERNRVKNDLMEQTRDKFNEFLTGFGMQNAGIIAEGEPYKGITSFSAEKGIDLIVMGARGLSFVQEMLIGSVTDAVLKSSACPVLVIH